MLRPVVATVAHKCKVNTVAIISNERARSLALQSLRHTVSGKYRTATGVWAIYLGVKTGRRSRTEIKGPDRPCDFKA